MSDASLFLGAALPWLRRASEDEAREVFNRLDTLISTRDRPRALTMRANMVLDANRRQIPAAAEPVSRWDRRPPGVIFREGFRPRVVPVGIRDFRDTSDISLNLHRFVNDHVRSVFVSTTRPVMGANGVQIWQPPNIDGRYRYEIFAYGGIDVLATFPYTFGGRPEIRYPEQEEITFVGGIRPELIRTATEYDSRGRVVAIWRNVHFQPALNGPHAPRPYQLPALPENTNSIRFLDQSEHDTTGDGSSNPHHELRRRRDVQSVSQNTVASSGSGDADENDGDFRGYKLVANPDASKVLPTSHVRRASHLLPSGDQAIFFAGEQFVTLKLDKSAGLADSITSEGVQTIVNAWPALHESLFPEVDAILGNPDNSDEAYFFYRQKYVLVNVKTRKKVFEAKTIVNEWPSLKQVGFTTVDAAVLMSDGTAYFFKGNQYVRVKVNPGSNSDSVVGSGPKPIRGNWSVLDKAGFTTVDSILTSPVGQNQYFFNGNNYVRMVIHSDSSEDELMGSRQPVGKGWSSLVTAGFYPGETWAWLEEKSHTVEGHVNTATLYFKGQGQPLWGPKSCHDNTVAIQTALHKADPRFELRMARKAHSKEGHTRTFNLTANGKALLRGHSCHDNMQELANIINNIWASDPPN